MAGDWIKMRLDLQTHPKVVRILSATKSDKFRAIGGLHAVWSVFDTHSSDGRLEGYTPETLDHIIGWSGFSSAMIAVGWLACDGPETLILPEFDEHNGKSGKRRAEDMKRKREVRKDPQPVRKLSANDADEKRTREEKRREEKKEESKPPSASAPGLPGVALEQRQGVLDAIEDQLPAGPSGEVPAAPPAFEEPGFEQAWALYPKREGGNPRKDALGAWNARIKEGVTAAEMIAGVERYAAYLKAKGKIGTQYVLQGSTFFGPSARYAEAWSVQQSLAPAVGGRRSINDFGSDEAADDDPFNQLRRAP